MMSIQFMQIMTDKYEVMKEDFGKFWVGEKVMSLLVFINYKTLQNDLSMEQADNKLDKMFWKVFQTSKRWKIYIAISSFRRHQKRSTAWQIWLNLLPTAKPENGAKEKRNDTFGKISLSSC